VRVIGKSLFGMRSDAKTIPPGKIAKEECHRLKSITSLYLKDVRNRELPFFEFCRKAPCMYLHHFNDHSCCAISWCKTLQSQRTDGLLPKPVLNDQYLRRFRDKEIDWVTFKAVEAIYEPYMTESALRQCYHGQDTNKNESLHRKCSATAPKDRYFSGSMSLSDRFHFVAIYDSVGYGAAYKRVLRKLCINLMLASPVLEEWCRRVDHASGNRTINLNLPEVKGKRQAKTRAMVKAWIVGERKATNTGRDYASGSAIAATPTPAQAAATVRMEDPHWKKVEARSELTLAQLVELEDSSASSSTDGLSGDDQIQFGDI
jgi:hypothetical protein